MIKMINSQYLYYCLIPTTASTKPISELQAYLLESNYFTQISEQEFRNKPNFTFMSIGLVYTQNGNYAIPSNPIPTTINHITIICSDNNSNLIVFLENFAHFLDWELVLENEE